MIEFVIPVKTVNESNGSHGHWSVKAKRRNDQHWATKAAIYAIKKPLPSLPVTVYLTRISSGQLDAHDNLRGSLKAIVDEIANQYGKSDNDPRFRWEYAQEKCKRGAYGVRVRIEGAG